MATSSAAAVPPNQTLYVNNLNDKIRKPDLRLSLYTLFSTYGVVLDVVALKTPKHRGQAHIAFRDVGSATQAMRSLQGMNIFGKDMRISYAKGKSNTIAKLDGTFRIPTMAQKEEAAAAAAPFAALPGAGSPMATEPTGAAAAPVTGQKRPRDEESEEEEMDMEDDDD